MTIKEENKIDLSLLGKPLNEIVDMIHDDYHLLDAPLSDLFGYKLIIGHEKSAVRDSFPSVIRLVTPPKILGVFKLFPVLYDLIRSIWLIGSADPKTCILIDAGYRFGMLTCILNSFIPIRKRKILVWEMYIPTGKLKKWLARRIILGSSITIVYSQRQQSVQWELLGVPPTKLVFLPYKAIDSVSPPIEMHIGGYIFSGGTSRRDYQTLFAAVRDTGIPVIVSTANPNIVAIPNIPENVILLTSNIHANAFARLMAGSCFVVIPITPGLFRGAGEATVLNAMWHGRAVICADDICAFEYIDEGVTGYVTPPGDASRLRERIIELWNHPDKATEMGYAAHRAIAANYTVGHFSYRLKALGTIVAASI